MPPESAVELGLMTGVPPFPSDGQVTLANWQDPPYNRWGFQHVRELIPTANISRGLGKRWMLQRAERDLDGLALSIGGRRLIDFPAFLDETYTDGILVLHRGKVVLERYLNGMRTDTTAYFPLLQNQSEHGGVFDYRSVLTDMLGWVMERASGIRLPELISRSVWQPMGAESDAEITVDAHGNAMADGGVCATLRDLA